MAVSDIPQYAWKRRLSEVVEAPGKPHLMPFWEIVEDLLPIMRLWGYVNRERRAGRRPLFDPFHPVTAGPYGGVPLGGIGGGSIMRGWQGDFGRWHMQAGIVEYQSVPADQFTVYVKRKNKRPALQVMYPGSPATGSLSGWAWDLPAKKSTYHALFPRAWSVYEEPDPDVRLTCRQISPVIPGNYKESSYPVGVFAWEIENLSSEPASVSIMFTFQNGTGTDNDRMAGHTNQLFKMTGKGGEVTGIALRHKRPMTTAYGLGPEDAENFNPKTYEDPLTFAIAALGGKGIDITYRTRFVTSGSGMDVWSDLEHDGQLENVEDPKPNSQGLSIGAALCVTVEVPARGKREVAFALSWDAPLARFGGGRAHWRRYTQFYGREGKAAPAIARDALLNYPEWEKQIEAWQKPILADSALPDWYKTALFNELYFITDGGTIWTDGEEKAKPGKDDEGHFAYLEGHEYLIYNTYDTHFYASWALAMLWPKIELGIQRDFAAAIKTRHNEEINAIWPGSPVVRKESGIVAHDMGSPLEDPWRRLNAYSIYGDASHWKDLNSKFALQVYRDVVLTGDKKFAAEMWEPVQAAIRWLGQFDYDEDGLIENEGFADQTYSHWPVSDASAYTGGLWLGALSAAAALGDLLGKKSDAAKYRKMLGKAQESYEDLLWNGEYYDYDASSSRYHDTVMADQLAGQWYARACGLKPIVPEENAVSALEWVYKLNVEQFEGGDMGAVNGMRPDGRLDSRYTQAAEVWVGTTYAVAAAMLQEGLDDEAWDTAKGAALMTYRDLGHWFQTPEGWDARGDHRALAYMRPLAIWAMQWAWERGKKKRR